MFVISWCYRAQHVNNFDTTLLKNCCDAVPPSTQQEKKIEAKGRSCKSCKTTQQEKKIEDQTPKQINELVVRPLVTQATRPSFLRWISWVPQGNKHSLADLAYVIW